MQFFKCKYAAQMGQSFCPYSRIIYNDVRTAGVLNIFVRLCLFKDAVSSWDNIALNVTITIINDLEKIQNKSVVI
jgi:hypothetical protein